jgi:hypothetical protein
MNKKTSLNFVNTPGKAGANPATRGNPVIATIPVFQYPGKNPAPDLIYWKEKSCPEPTQEIP